MKLENWCVAGDSNPYIPPDLVVRILKGNVYGNPRFEDGERIHTSGIAAVDGRKITTKTGSVYELGEVEPEFLEWCKKNGHHLPVGDNPIKVKQ